MNGTSGFQEVRSSTPRSPTNRSCTSSGLKSEKVPGTFSLLTILSLSRQASAQREKRFLTPFQNTSDPSSQSLSTVIRSATTGQLWICATIDLKDFAVQSPAGNKKRRESIKVFQGSQSSMHAVKSGQFTLDKEG
jgi:hypothetical protein